VLVNVTINYTDTMSKLYESLVEEASDLFRKQGDGEVLTKIILYY